MAVANPYWTAWVATLTFFAAFYTLLVALPGYLTGVGLPDWQIGLVLGAFGVASLIGRPIAGVMTDRYGARRIMLAGSAALTIGALAVPATTDVTVLFALRVLQALGYVAFTTAGTALVVTLVAPQERGRRLALFGAAANVAVTVTPALVGALLALTSPTAAFPAVALMALLAGTLAARLPAAHAGERSAASGGAWAEPRREREASGGRSGPPQWPEGHGALVGERSEAPGEREGLAPRKRAGERVQRDASGGVWPTAEHARQLLPAALATLLLGATFAAFFFFAPLLAERRAGPTAGTLYLIYGLAIIATRLTSGRLVDRLHVGQVVALAAVLTALGHALIAATTTVPPLILAPVLIAAGGGLFHPALIAHHAALLPDAPGRAAAAFYVAFDLGIGLGSWLFGLALELAGLPGLYWCAAALAVAVLPLMPSLTRGAARARP